MLVAFRAAAVGQSSQLRSSITVTDSASHSTVIAFGVDVAATRCIDPALGEFELPPGGCSSAGLCIAFKDVHEDSSACLGEGLLLDLRMYNAPTQIDSYLIEYSFQNYPVVFRWSPALGMTYDSVRLRDELGGAFVDVNMVTTDSLVLPAPFVSRLLIAASGPKLAPAGVNDERRDVPTMSLGQNYPNPFNPVTAISYALTAPGMVRLQVFDLLGRSVATLVDGWQRAGTHVARWDARAEPSGMYYCRLYAGRSVATRTMLLVK